ncbi:MAG: DUF2281 domain-containing protein [Bacillota bacterium]|nr:DUF2281 domain-containing protein [Bacillota bacterium]
MVSKEALLKKIESLPPNILQELAAYLEYIEYKRSKYDRSLVIDDITLASEKALAKDWLKPEEDEAWADL